MRTQRGLAKEVLCGALCLLMALALTPALPMSGQAETSNPSEIAPSPEWPSMTVETIDEPILRTGSARLSPSMVRNTLEHFLANFLALARSSRLDLEEESEILTYTLIPFLASEQFKRIVADSQRERNPIELMMIHPRRLEEAKMIEEFSQGFRLPLDFEPNQKIVPSSVTISLNVPWYGIPIQVKTPGKEAYYLIDSKEGSILTRVERSA